MLALMQAGEAISETEQNPLHLEETKLNFQLHFGLPLITHLVLRTCCLEKQKVTLTHSGSC